MYYIALLIVALISGISMLFIAYSVNKYKKIINPVGLLLIPIIFGLIFVLQDGEIINEQIIDGLIWFGIGIVLYLLFFALIQNVHIVIGKRYKNDNELLYNYNVVRRLIYICCFLMFLSAVLYLQEVMKVAGSFSLIFTSSTYVRILYMQRTKTFISSLFGWFLTTNILVLSCLFPIAIKMKVPHAKLMLLIAIFLRTFESIITMSKQSIIVYLVFILSAFADDFKSKRAEWKFLKKYLKWFALVILIMLVIVSYQRNYLAQKYDSYTSAVIGTITRYTSTPIYSFCVLVSSKIEHTFGTQCFRPIVSIGSKLLGFDTGSSIQETVLGATANVYTMFGNMYNDFGKLGIVFLSIFFGTFYGVLYRNNSKSRLDIIVINSIINMTMFMGFYDFLMMQTVYFITILYAPIFCMILNKVIYVKE